MTMMPLFDLPFLRATWTSEFEQFVAGGRDQQLLENLLKWAKRVQLGETSSSAAFIKQFFVDIWGYTLQGSAADGSYQCFPEFPVVGAGQTGGKGKADLAIGQFGHGLPGVPQVVCEFKDIKSGLDAPQNRKGNSRTPVQQALDYLRESRTALAGTELVEPQWAIVTDMNEFRLYHASKGHAQCQRFLITSIAGADQSLLAGSDEGAFARFLFWKMFSPSELLAERGPSQLAKRLKNQITHEKDVEEGFYREYKAYREHLFRAITAANPDFAGTKGKLVRLTQRLLDRCLFLLFCEDMGEALRFPLNLLRDALSEYSQASWYDSDDAIPWIQVKKIFEAMDKGGKVGKSVIGRFNGGLFQPLPELEQLHVPASVFCAEGQGENADSLVRHSLTLLYFSAKYNFGVKTGASGKVIDFYALGRIFEQSITELEIMEAEADGRDSLNLLTKRKRDGVYYTPEWVTSYIVEETVGARLRELKAEVGLAADRRPDEADLELYLGFLRDKRRAAPRAAAWLAALQNYRSRLDRLRVVDPACGSGAFLIQTLEFLKAEYRWVIGETERITRSVEIWDADVVVNSILTKNIYGVDINAESVEIAKLALWMHTASPGKPLSSLDRNIQCGNSLVGPDFYTMFQAGLFSDDERDRVNAFDWRAAFPEVFANGGFDCVVGNPPYVKLQHFRRVQDKVARYLVEARKADGTPVYASTQTGNFDLYLPFIERGLGILNASGRMGYIAPNLWMVNDYGVGLRKAVLRGQQLERWVDFKSFQVFDEAITYTALQFLTATAQPSIRCAFAHDGAIARIDWASPDAVVPYGDLSAEDTWNLMPDAERRLADRLRSDFAPLVNRCEGIAVGIQTSADHIYHLTRLENGSFRTRSGREVAIESELMRPLVSGAEAKRYQEPKTNTYLLFPYKLDEAKARLFSPLEMAARFPVGWAYLRENEAELRARENARMDRDGYWHGYNYPKNLDKQETPKLLVPRLVERLFCAPDPVGEFFLDNVDVGGVLPCRPQDLYYLAAMLNAPVANFVWRRLSKPFQNNYFSANKQFIAPLPIPDASPEDHARVAEFAKKLQKLHTTKRDTIAKFNRRLTSSQTVADPRTESWIWADMGTAESWKSQAPSDMKPSEKTAWAKAQLKTRIDTHTDDLSVRLKPGAKLVVEGTADEIRLKINGVVAIQLFDQSNSELITAQWRNSLRTVRVTEAFDGAKLVRLLLDLRATPDPALAASLVALDREVDRIAAEIDELEHELNTLTYKLYRLTPEEIALVER